MTGVAQRIALPVLGADRGREDELARDGWTRRFAAAPPRLDEMIALYRSLGLEVRDEPLDPRGPEPDCAGCIVAAGSSRVIFTREPR
jgi:hypothetical protein